MSPEQQAVQTGRRLVQEDVELQEIASHGLDKIKLIKKEDRSELEEEEA